MLRRQLLQLLVTAPACARAPVRARAPSRALRAAHPALRRALPWTTIADLPTPVEPRPELARRLGLGALWIKRDDLTASPYGGNKVRKLELFFADALARKKSRVITFGGVGSNHALATAIHARRLGLGATLLLLPQQKSRHVRHNLLAMADAGAELHPARSTDERRAVSPHSSEHTYVIPTGGTSPLGDIGLVDAGFELAEQVRRGELPEPDEVWVALGTGGTAAGIALGLAAAGLRTRVVCVRVSSPRYGTWSNLARAFAATRDRLRSLDPSFPHVELDTERARIVHDHAGRGYGIASERGRRAAALARELGDLELDATYTAKTFAALVAASPARAGKVIVFWDTFDPRRLAADASALQRLPSALRGYAL